MKNLLLSLMAVQVHSFEFEDKELYCKELTVKESDECLEYLDGEKSTSSFTKYKNKFIAYSLCDKDGKSVVSVSDIEKLSNTKIADLYLVINKKIGNEEQEKI